MEIKMNIRKALIKKALVIYCENLHKIDVQTKSLSTMEILTIIYKRLVDDYMKGEIEL